MRKNEERLLQYLREQWEEAGKPELLPISANRISKNFKFEKRKTIYKHYSEYPSHVAVIKTLKKLTNEGKIVYDTSKITTPTVRIL